MRELTLALLIIFLSPLLSQAQSPVSFQKDYFKTVNRAANNFKECRKSIAKEFSEKLKDTIKQHDKNKTKIRSGCKAVLKNKCVKDEFREEGKQWDKVQRLVRTRKFELSLCDTQYALEMQNILDKELELRVAFPKIKLKKARKQIEPLLSAATIPKKDKICITFDKVHFDIRETEEELLGVLIDDCLDFAFGMEGREERTSTSPKTKVIKSTSSKFEVVVEKSGDEYDVGYVFDSRRRLGASSKIDELRPETRRTKKAKKHKKKMKSQIATVVANVNVFVESCNCADDEIIGDAFRRRRLGKIGRKKNFEKCLLGLVHTKLPVNFGDTSLLSNRC